MPHALRLITSRLAARVAATCVAVAVSVTMSAAGAAAAELQLLMFERDGCVYCRQWNEEIAPAYPKTAEGQAAPLARHDVTEPLPEGVVLDGRPPVFTPTFVLLADGAEVSRIEGYAGDEFFWVMLARMLQDAGWAAEAAAQAPPAEPGGTP